MPALAAHPRAEVVAFCGRDLQRTEAAAGQFGVPRAFTDLDELLATEQLDALMVLSPPSHHVPACLRAAAAGLSLYCEKPLGVTAAETCRLLDACAGLRTAVGFTSRWDPAVRRVRALLERGELGALRHVRVSYANAVVADPRHPWHWRFEPAEYPLGVLTDLGSHAFDLVRWFGGEVLQVAAAGSVVHGTRSDAVAGAGRAVTNLDEAHARVAFASGASASLWCSRVTSPAFALGRFELEVICSEATAFVSADHPGIVGLTRGGATEHFDLNPARTGKPGSDLLELMRGRAEFQVDEILQHLDARLPAQPAVPDFAAGHACQRLLDAAGRSLADGGRPALVPDRSDAPFLPHGDEGER
jgi:predicted dehydrogenase